MLPRPLTIVLLTLVLARLDGQLNSTYFPWLENLMSDLQEFSSSTMNSTILNTNHTKHRTNSSNIDDDFIITDEDVADIDDHEVPINTPIYDGETTKIAISTDAGTELYQHWADQAVSGLMAAFATKQLKKGDPEVKKIHFECTKRSKSVQEHAKCISELMEITRKREEFLPPPLPVHKAATKETVKSNYVKSNSKLHKSRKTHTSKNSHHSKSKYSKDKKSKRTKRALVQTMQRPVIQRRTSYSLHDTSKDNYKEPLSVIAKKLTNTIRSFKKNADQPQKSWQQTIEDIEQEGILVKKKEKMKRLLNKRSKDFQRDFREANETLRKDLFLKNMELSMNNDVDDVELNNRDELLNSAKEAEEKLSPRDQLMKAPIQLIREGVKLGMVLSGQDISNFDNKTIRMISPKLMSLAPEERTAEDTINLLSPTLLSFRNDSGIFSLPSLLNVFDNESQEEWMNFVFEASGVTEAVDMIRYVQDQEERKEMRENFLAMTRLLQKDYVSNNETLDEIPFEKEQKVFSKDNATKILGNTERRKIDHIEELHKMLTEEQIKVMNDTGYTRMTEKQLKFFYGENSPYENLETLERLSNVSDEHIEPAIESVANLMAEGQAKFEVSRRKDIVLMPLTFTSVINAPDVASQPLILSPLLVVPVIFSPSIFGCVILSPWVFVPVIIAPRILGPVVLSPILFSPVILSPLALIPVVLSPGVGLPLILSPFALAPFILSPVVLTPLILSPFVLSPFIIVPNVLSPMILSPFVLSPLILSPPAVSAFILNPYALSPVIKSEGAVFTAVLSPSWLS